MLNALWVALALQAASAPPPELRHTPEGLLIVDSTARETTTYQIRFNPGVRLSAAERLERLIGPEPFEVVEEDVEAATATVRLTRRAAFSTDTTSWAHLGIVAMTPERPRTLPEECFQLLVELRSNGSAPDAPPEPRPEICPGSVIADGLVIEGLGRRGRRLWLAAAPDDREVRSVMGPNGEGHGPPVRVQVESLSALISIPTVEGLERLRWYEVTQERGLRLIGESRWRRPG